MQYKSKDEFPKDKATGKTILGSAEAMREWVELGFEEQKKQHIDGIPFYPYIDLIDSLTYAMLQVQSQELKSWKMIHMAFCFKLIYLYYSEGQS